MNNRKVSIVLGIIVTVLAIVSVFTLFATAFGASDAPGHPSTLGSCFDVMFGKQGFSAVPTLIVAFVLQCAAIAVGIVGAILPGRIGGITLGVAAALLVGAGIIWFMSPSLFSAINPLSSWAETVSLGTGSILTAVFCLVAALLGLYSGYRSFKN